VAHDAFFYVYALKDPRTSPARPFYIGKGIGSRATDHLITPDRTRKYIRIREIRGSGAEPSVVVLADGLSELQALRVEAALISEIGTAETGGPLLNTVIPTGRASGRPGLTVPTGVVERAQLGLDLLKTAIVELAGSNTQGVTNSDVARTLGLKSDYRGRQKDYLSYSLLGLLLREGKLSRAPNGSRHVSAQPPQGTA